MGAAGVELGNVELAAKIARLDKLDRIGKYGKARDVKTVKHIHRSAQCLSQQLMGAANDTLSRRPSLRFASF